VPPSRNSHQSRVSAREIPSGPFSSLSLCALFYATLVPSLVQTTSLSHTLTTYTFWVDTTLCLNSSKSETHSLDAIRDNGISLLGLASPRTARHAFRDEHIKLERKLIERLPSLPKQNALLLLRILYSRIFATSMVPIFRRPHSLMGSPRLPAAELRAPDSVSRAFPRRSASCRRGGPYQPANPPGGLRDSFIRQMRPTCLCSSERVSERTQSLPNSSIKPAHQRADAVPE